MAVFHVEPNGQTNTAAYVSRIVAATADEADVDVRVFTSAGSRYEASRALPVFSGYRAAGSAARKAQYYAAGWVRIVRRLAEEGESTILHHHWPKLSPLDALMLGFIRRFLPHVRIVGTVHNMLPHEPAGFDPFFFERIYRYSHQLTFFCPTSIRQFHRMFEGVDVPYTTIPHYGYDVVDATPRDRMNTKMLFFGAIRPYKGLDVLLDACARLPNDLAWSLTVAGKPEHVDVASLQHAASEQGIADRVDWRTGWIEDDEVDQLFQEHDIVVLPYREVDSSGLLHLAMSYGKVVIATRVGCLQDTIEHGRNGLLCAPNDATALLQQLESVLHDSSAGVPLARRARRTMMEEHGLPRIGALHREVYAAATQTE